MFTSTSNAEEVADDLLGVVDPALADADAEAADLALSLVDPKTPRRSGRLAAGLRSTVAAEGGFDLVDEVPYAAKVDARTGFATDTILNADAAFGALYDTHLQRAFDAL